jgi:hypothetical protein
MRAPSKSSFGSRLLGLARSRAGYLPPDAPAEAAVDCLRAAAEVLTRRYPADGRAVRLAFGEARDLVEDFARALYPAAPPAAPAPARPAGGVVWSARPSSGSAPARLLERAAQSLGLESEGGAPCRS